MTKIEEIARAIDPAAWESLEVYIRMKGYDDPFEIQNLKLKNISIARSMTRARAAVEAMREPTEAMALALLDEVSRLTEQGVKSHGFIAIWAYRAMIDSILSDTEGR